MLSIPAPLDPFVMKNVICSFTDLTLFQEQLKTHVQGGSHLARDERGRCKLNIGGFCYTVDFRERTVRETWWQTVKNFFASHCGNGSKPKTSELKKLIFVPGPHFTEPDVAKWVFRKQMDREGVPIPIPAYSWLGEAKPPSGELSRFKYLGRGAFARVNAVVWGSQAGPLMVKKTAIDAEEIPELMEEQALLARLDHSNIIHCYPGVAPEGSMLMDYGGATLLGAMGEHMCDEPKEVLLSCCRQLLSPIAYLHDRNIVHRDIKPDNVLINPNTRHMQLADFGLAADLGPTGTSDECSGTPEYMAPEVHFKKPYRTKPDVYSAGCVIFAMLCDQPLRNDDAIKNGIYQSREQLGLLLPIYLLTVREQFDAQERATLANVLGAMLDPDPMQRITAQRALEIFASFDADA